MSNFYTPGGAALSSNSEEWETPRALFEELNKEFNFTLDAASSVLIWNGGGKSRPGAFPEYGRGNEGEPEEEEEAESEKWWEQNG